VSVAFCTQLRTLAIKCGQYRLMGKFRGSCGVSLVETLTTYQALKRAAKGATLKIQRDLSPKRVMERGQYQTRPPQWVTLDQRKHITKTYYQCRGAQGQHDDGILFPLFRFSIHTPFTQKTALERAS